MGKRRIRENLSTAEESVADAAAEANDGRSDVRADEIALSASKTGVKATTPARTYPKPRSHQQLGNAILDAADPVKVGVELLDKDNDDRGAPNRLRSLETFAEWAFGKHDAEGERRPPRIIWDIPGPPYEPVDPELEKLEGGEK
jgi:hypothetical protein